MKNVILQSKESNAAQVRRSLISYVISNGIIKLGFSASGADSFRQP